MLDLDPGTLWTSIGGALAVAAAVFFGPSLARRVVRGGAASARASDAGRPARGGREAVAPAPRDAAGAPRPARPSGDALVALRGATRVYPDADGETVTALGGVDLDVREGELLAVIGPSGFGKSTLLNLLGGIDFPTRGTLLWKGEPLPARESPQIHAHRARSVCFVFQDLNLVTHLTAEENAALPLLCQGVERATALAEARAQLGALGLGRLLHRRAHQLSGGQRQRVAIARAFASRAPLLLADEPTGSLDPDTAASVMDAFATRAREAGRTVVLVTHDTALARRTCDRVLHCSPHGLRDVTDASDDVRAGTSAGAAASDDAPARAAARPSAGARAHVARGRPR